MPSTSTPRDRALAAASGAGRRSYWQLSRAPRYSLVFALPLLLFYEGLAAFLSGPNGAGVRNGADVIIKSLFFTVAGARGPLIFALALIGLSIWFVARDLRRNRGGLRLSIFATMLGESAALALVFGVVVGTVTARIVGLAAAPHDGGALLAAVQGAAGQLDAPTRLMVSLGAGLYEELLFRVVLVSAILLLARTVMGWPNWAAGTAAVVLGALAFSAFHYIGPYGEPLRLDSFVFRTVAGLAFSGLYVLRGFGITAWTHALYDVFLLVA
jgi:CAAX prenyl protease-like protein